MESSSSQRIAGIKQYLRQNASSAGKTVGQLRTEEAGRIKLLKPPADATYAKVTIAGLSAEWVRDASVPAEVEETVLYFHGGGFVTGSCAVYRELAARISKAGRVKVLVVEYRLAPEHKWPAAHDDCLSAYRALLAQGILPEKLALGGDSIGGTLVLTSLLALRDAHENLPAAAFLMSPHTDLVDLDGETYTSNADSDPTGSRESTQMCLNWLLDTPIDPPAILSPWKLNLDELHISSSRWAVMRFY
jgi:acetyl esterase/lipase